MVQGLDLGAREIGIEAGGMRAKNTSQARFVPIC